MKTKRIATQIMRYAGLLGCDVEHDWSMSSEANYLTVTLCDNVYKIRIADHEPRPSYERIYGTADYEVGEHQAANGNWYDSVRWLAHQIGRPVPPQLIACERRTAAAARTRRQRREARLKAIHQRVAKKTTDVADAIDACPDARRHRSIFQKYRYSTRPDRRAKRNAALAALEQYLRSCNIESKDIEVYI